MTNSVVICGHITNDVVFEGEKELYRCKGGVANVQRALVDLGIEEPNVAIAPSWKGSAEIEICKRTSSKHALSVNIREEKIIPKFPKNNPSWCHIAYLNELTSEDFKEILSVGIHCRAISADVCFGTPPDPKWLGLIDYLFVSEDEVEDLTALYNNVGGWLIVHTENGSVSYNRKANKKHVSTHELLRGCNVLGAGDYFAAAFIDQRMKKKTFGTCIDNAHKLTSIFLRDRQ